MHNWFFLNENKSNNAASAFAIVGTTDVGFVISPSNAEQLHSLLDYGCGSNDDEVKDKNSDNKDLDDISAESEDNEVEHEDYQVKTTDIYKKI